MFKWLFNRKPKEPQWKINVHLAAQTDVVTAAAWTLYAGTKAIIRMGRYFELHPERQGQTSPFHEEWFARDALAEYWAAKPDEERPTDPYLDLLVCIRAAGLIREYVWHFLRDENWPEPEDIDRTSFEKWMVENDSRDHRPLTLSSIVLE